MLTTARFFLCCLLIYTPDAFTQERASVGMGDRIQISRDKIVKARPEASDAKIADLRKYQLNAGTTTKSDLDGLSSRAAAMTTMTPEDAIRKRNFITALEDLKQCTTCSAVMGGTVPAGTVPMTFDTSTTSTSKVATQKQIGGLCDPAKLYYNTVTKRCLTKQEVAHE